MENENTDIYNRVVVNSDPDFVENENADISVSFVILCEQNFDNEINRIYEQKVAGISLAEWVAMACESKPNIVYINSNDNFLNVIRPCLTDKDYLVVLYGDTPLVSKTHLKDLLCYVSRKGLNVCKLKRGYILKNSFVKQADNLYFALNYDLETNDFFQVKSYSDIDKVKGTLENRMFNYHKKNGVFFEDQKTTTIDANVKIGRGSYISAGSFVLSGSMIGENVFVGESTIIKNSNIWIGSKVSPKCIIENSIVKENVKIGLDSLISYSVLSGESEVGISSKLIKSTLGENSKVENFCMLQNASILDRAKIGTFSAIIGDGVTINIEKDSEILAGSKVVKKEE